MDPNEPAPWPIIAGLVALAAVFGWAAAVTTYDAAAMFAFLAATGSACIAAHMTAEAIIHRIRTTRGDQQ